MTRLLVVMELWTEMLDSGDPVYAVYLVFSKAFDTVPHQRLLNKLKPYGIVGNSYGWIRAFLTGHTHQVVVNSSLIVAGGTKWHHIGKCPRTDIVRTFHKRSL